MTTIDHTKRRFNVTIATKIGANFKSTAVFTCAQIDQYRKQIKEGRVMEFPVSPNSIITLAHDIFGFMIVDEIIVDKLTEKKESIILTPDI